MIPTGNLLWSPLYLVDNPIHRHILNPVWCMYCCVPWQQLQGQTPLKSFTRMWTINNLSNKNQDLIGVIGSISCNSQMNVVNIRHAIVFPVSAVKHILALKLPKLQRQHLSISAYLIAKSAYRWSAFKPHKHRQHVTDFLNLILLPSSAVWSVIMDFLASYSVTLKDCVNHLYDGTINKNQLYRTLNMSHICLTIANRLVADPPSPIAC